MLSTPLRLPNGTTLKNRIGKAAMSEQLGTRELAPDEGLATLYETWGRGGAGLLITGNVMVDRRALGETRNVVLETGCELEPYRRWAAGAQCDGAVALMQLNHPGRQSPRSASPESVAPSAVQLKGFAGVFGKPRVLTDEEIRGLIKRFAEAAGLAVAAGFQGVELHAAHGYLISQFLSPNTNLRTDDWGGTPEARRRFLLETLHAVRTAIGQRVLAVKLNSADFQRGGFSEEESMDVVRVLNDASVDLLEISGGTYERAPWQGEPQRESTKAREGYFLAYAERVRTIAKMPLMLTGGLRTTAGMRAALESGAVDVVGMARPFAVEPDLPARLLSGESTAAMEIELETGLKKLDDFLEVSWYQQQIQRMARGLKPEPDSCRLGAVLNGLTQAFTHRPRSPRQLALTP